MSCAFEPPAARSTAGAQSPGAAGSLLRRRAELLQILFQLVDLGLGGVLVLRGLEPHLRQLGVVPHRANLRGGMAGRRVYYPGAPRQAEALWFAGRAPGSGPNGSQRSESLPEIR